jgi:hypothetical protein
MKYIDIRRKYLKEVEKGIFIPPKTPLVFNEEYVMWLERKVLKLNLACVNKAKRAVCPLCNGTGRRKFPNCNPPIDEVCPACKGQTDC